MLRHATTVLFVSALALAAPAPNLEISQKLLDHEARTRAAFTPAERARVQALEAALSTKMSVGDVTAMTRGEPTGSIFAVMMQYLKMVQKEAREDQKMARAAGNISQTAKAAKLESDNKKIEKQMSEAGEKAQSLMNAATTSLVTGIGAGDARAAAAHVGPAAAAHVAPAAPTPTRTPTAVRRNPGAGK
jgi:hypothetical protein